MDTDQLIKHGTEQVRKILKPYVSRLHNKSTEHKIRKKILSWINTNLPQQTKEEKIQVASRILVEYMRANEGYNAASEHATAKRRQEQAVAQEPKEVVAEIGGEEIQLS